jgi:ABC-type polysaccharide/polyol phosphate transport system ATPase subunit
MGSFYFEITFFNKKCPSSLMRISSISSSMKRKKILSISVGSSSRDHTTRHVFLGEECELSRKGTDGDFENLVNSPIRSIAERGITVLLVEHSMKVVMGVCERICFLNYGEKMVEGRPEEIQRDKRVIEAYLGTEYAARS